MFVLEVLFWMALGALVALVRRVWELPHRRAREPTVTTLLCAAAGLAGGLIGLAVLRPTPRLGDFNVAGIVLSVTAAAVVLVARDAIHERRPNRSGRTA